MQKPVTEKKKYFVVRERAVPEVLLKVVDSAISLEYNSEPPLTSSPYLWLIIAIFFIIILISAYAFGAKPATQFAHIYVTIILIIILRNS